MKRNVLKFTAILLILAGSLSTCKDKEKSTETDRDTFLTKLSSSPSSIMPKESLPEWLAVKMNQVETRPPLICKVQIYKGKWNKKTVYFILDTFSACLCDFYTEDGVRIVDNLSDCRETSKNWMLIYEYGEFI